MAKNLQKLSEQELRRAILEEFATKFTLFRLFFRPGNDRN